MFRIYETGSGFPCTGEKVYNNSDNMIYTVVEIGRDILTLDWKPGHMLATLELACSPDDLDTAEFRSLRSLRIEEINDGC